VVNEWQVEASADYDARIASEKRRRSLEARCVPKILWSASRADFGPQELDGEIPAMPTSLLIAGLPGRGKSYLAAALAAEWSALWCDVAWLIVETRSTFGRSGGESEVSILNRYAAVRTLVLDDLTAVAPTDYALKTILALLSRRIGDGLTTVVTVNQSGKQISALEPSIASRLSGFHRVRMLGDDRRTLVGRKPEQTP